MLKSLIRKGSNVNSVSSLGNAPLDDAAGHSDTEIVRNSAESGAEVAAAIRLG